MQFNGTQEEWDALKNNTNGNLVKFENTNLLPNQSITDENDDLTDDEWVIKELKKEIENLYTKEQMQEAILQILEYVVKQMEKKEKINTKEILLKQ